MSTGKPPPMCRFLGDFLYLRRHAEHLERRRYVESRRNLDVAEVDSEGLTPDAEMADVENGQLARKSQHDGFSIVPTKLR